MNVTINDKKKEAVERMLLWKIFPQTKEQFRRSNLVSESVPPVGACFWLNDEQKERVKAFEQEHNALVYHVIHCYTNMGELENYLFVSDYKDEWQTDRNDIKKGQQLVYVNNLSAPDCSEFGMIGVKRTIAAGLQRVW